MPVAVRKPKVSTPPVGHHVPTLRAALGLSQEALAQALGVSSRTVARWEEGAATPSSLAQTRLRLLAEIQEKARRLFKGKEAEVWLRTPNPLLAGQAPLDRLRSPGGLEAVREFLGRIEWDIPT